MKLLPPVQLPANHNLMLWGDDHEGSVLRSQKGWSKLLDVMSSEYDGVSANYGVDMGDPIEAIMVDDARYSVEKLTEPLPLEQMKRAVEHRKPIASQMLCMLDGNHTRKLWRFGNITEEICNQLGVAYGTYTAKITVNDSNNNLMYKIYATHGFRSITSTADDPQRRRTNMGLILKRHLKFKAADCVLMVKGHTHKLLSVPPIPELFLYDDGKQIKQGYTGSGQAEPYIHPDARWYGNTGSFLRLFGKGISGYAEVFELDPTELGWLVLKIRGKRIVDLQPYYLNI